MTWNVGQAEFGNLIEVQETERARIARELHDSLGQKVALLQIALDQISRTLPLREQTQLRQLSVQIDDIAQELHTVSYELHPLRLEILGLAKSIEALCKEIWRQSGIQIVFSCAHVPQDLGSSESLCLYRVAQEALHNVVKHSGAACACVDLARVRGELRLVVADTGRGFDKSAAANGLGLTSMRQRVELLNGAFAIHTDRDGTRVSVRIPVRRRAQTNDTVARRPRLGAEVDTGTLNTGHESARRSDTAPPSLATARAKETSMDDGVREWRRL